MIWSFLDRKEKGSKKDAQGYKGVQYFGGSRETLWDGECWEVMTVEMLTPNYKGY